MRKDLDGRTELYDLGSDVREVRDVSDRNPEVGKRVEEVFRTARVDSPLAALSPQPLKQGQGAAK